MSDLLTSPLWRSEDLGKPLPGVIHACSVVLPTWASVIGYEENDPQVTGRMQAGYPRFFCHPMVAELFRRAERDHAGVGEKCLVFPSEAAARQAVEFSLREGAQLAVAEPMKGGLGAWVVRFSPPEPMRPKLYWRYCGQIVSSRWAEAILDGWSQERLESVRASGEAATDLLRQRLADVSGQSVEDVFLYASGMAASYAAHQAITTLKPGLATVQVGFPYVDVLKIQENFGSGVHFFPGVGAVEMSAIGELLARESIAAVFCELPSNPLIECVDLPLLHRLARRAGTLIVADDTVATAINVDAFGPEGADLVTTSLTKAFSGMGDVMAGCVIVNGQSPWHDALRHVLRQRAMEAPLFGPDAVVLERNSRDFIPRVMRMNEAAEGLSKFLAQHPAVKHVFYPGVTDSAQVVRGGAYDSVRRPGGGGGMLLSFTLHDAALAPVVFDRLQVSKGPSLGTVFTLACPYTLLAHYPELEWAEQCGVDRHLIRVSGGLEGSAELIRRFASALEAVPALH